MYVSFDMVLKLIVLLGLSCQFSAVIGASVSETDCTSNGNECNSTANSACVLTKCKCNEGYNETTTACTKVLGTTCKLASDCSTIVPHSNCSTNCLCSPPYKEKKSICVKAISLTACTANGSECSQIQNAECVSKKCKCKTGFKDTVDACTKESNGATVSATTTTAVAGAVSKTACSTSGKECQSITNSACDETSLKCKCDAGFKETLNKCTAESKGTTLSSTTTALAGATLYMFALNKLF